MKGLYVGVMSGTSQDGIDAVLVDIKDGIAPVVLGSAVGQYDDRLRVRLVDLGREASPVSLQQFAELDREVAEAFASTINLLLKQYSVDPADIRAAGCHGQTVFHDADRSGTTIQLGDPSRIAALTAVPVVADFRRADMALGGQGAPLLPFFHQQVFSSTEEARAVLNLGGIANLSLLPKLGSTGDVIGFDCGPASCLMDEWSERHLNQAFDESGRWAASGQLDEALLNRLVLDPFFSRPIPKSTGRGVFNLTWLDKIAGGRLSSIPAENVQRTLCELTARTVTLALEQIPTRVSRLIVCGGGVRNLFLMERIRELLGSDCPLESASAHGLDPQLIEATAFAWLAKRRLAGEPGNLPSVTGACRPAILGGIFAP